MGIMFFCAGKILTLHYLQVVLPEWEGILGLFGKKAKSFILGYTEITGFHDLATPISGALLTDDYHWIRADMFSGVRTLYIARFHAVTLTVP